MLNQCLPVTLHARCHLIFLMGKELDAIKSICQRTYTFKTDSLLNDKSMLTNFSLGRFSVFAIVDCELAEVDNDCRRQ